MSRARDGRPAISVYRWDLDKTYLRTEFERLRELLRVPFEKAEDKVGVPGVAELIRALKAAARAEGRRALVYFVSASPPQIGRAIREKFALDGVEVDGIVFKDQLQILMKGRLRGLREQMGFKLTELLRGRSEVDPRAREFLFGDDWEADPVVYSLYADVIAGRIGPEALDGVLGEAGVDRSWREQIQRLLPAVPRAEAVRRIFIHLERQTPLAAFHAFTCRLVPAFNYFQTAACLYEEGELDVAGVELVGRALTLRDGYSRQMLENSLADVVRRGHLEEVAAMRLGDELQRRGVLPQRRTKLRTRLREKLRRWRASRRQRAAVRLKPPVPPAVELDYLGLVSTWRGER